MHDAASGAKLFEDRIDLLRSDNAATIYEWTVLSIITRKANKLAAETKTLDQISSRWRRFFEFD